MADPNDLARQMGSLAVSEDARMQQASQEYESWAATYGFRESGHDFPLWYYPDMHPQYASTENLQSPSVAPFMPPYVQTYTAYHNHSGIMNPSIHNHHDAFHQYPQPTSGFSQTVWPSSQNMSTQVHQKRFSGIGKRHDQSFNIIGITGPNHNSKTFRAYQAEPSCLRGPPRKPRQSGYGLWVGNLPSRADILMLKDHFSSEATEDIESIFLISKSNCAFVNYRNEDACCSAVERFHNSGFGGTRLVCRLQRASSSSGTAEPHSSVADSSSPSVPDDGERIDDVKSSISKVINQTPSTIAEEPAIPRRRFFIMKSLALEDLLSSVQDGYWVTQSHNERILNEAFEHSRNVYLIFSANRSGEYFGYARMRSRIVGQHSKSSPSAMDGADQSKSYQLALPEVRNTPATSSAPQGYVVHDRHRGTMFWEAVGIGQQQEKPNSSSPDGVTEDSADTDHPPNLGIEPDSGSQPSKPFEIEWISTTRVPFYMTRGLTNPWNSNREVKWARDGTEVETSAGIRLLELFKHGAAPTRF